MGNIFDNTQVAFALKSDTELDRAYFLFKMIDNEPLVRIGTAVTNFAIKANLPVEGLIRATVFDHFCGGINENDCLSVVDKMYTKGVSSVLDYSVEGKEEEAQFDAALAMTLKTIEFAKERQAIPFAVFKMTGIFQVELLEEFQTESGLSEENEAAFLHSKELLLEICQLAAELRVKLFIDAEESWIQTTIDILTYEMMEKFNQSQAIIFNTFQMYRVDMLENLTNAIAAAKNKNYFLGVKLVRGAYLEKERQRAHEDEYSEPLHKDKAHTDQDFNLGMLACLNNIDRVHFCIGTHNEYSCQLLAEEMAKQQIPHNHPNIYFAQLLGMSDNISYNLAASGYNVAKYVPYGPVESVMPYLFRRAEENSSIAGQTSREYTLLQNEVKRRKNA